MKILAKFFFKELLNTFFITYLVFFTITFSFDFIDKLDDILKAKLSISESVIFFAYRSVYLHSEYSNYAVLIALVIALNIMSQRNELVSLFTSGVFLKKIFSNVLYFVLIIGFVNFIFISYISPKFLLKSEKKINKKIAFEQIDDLIFKTDEGFIFVDLMIPAENILLNTYIVNVDDNKKIDKIIQAKRVEKSSSGWVGMDIKKYDVRDKNTTFISFLNLPVLNKLEGLTAVSYKPEWLTLRDIQKVVISGLRSGVNVKNYIYTLTKKIFSFFSLILLTILIFPLGIQLGRMKKNVEVVFLSIIILTAYSIFETVIFRFSRSINLFFVIPPLFIAFFLLLISYFLWKNHFFWKK
ncbi:MAG: LptF/LptG family permease [Proteobacteria bacterium]|nr:LptF/LptG family permease [Pseudomonadota bacterium]